LFGRTKLSPAISPSKTVEGLVGGGLTAVLIGAALSGVTPFSPLQAAAMSAAISTGGFFGGLDRLVSFASSPLFFHLTRYYFATYGWPAHVSVLGWFPGASLQGPI
jgi:phosphatidate cytidylyltransferase